MKSSETTLNPYPSILLVGDSGTHKTFFLGTCPSPYVFDFDGGHAILGAAGRSVDQDPEYDVFKDSPPGAKLPGKSEETGIYPYGKSWDAFLSKLNSIGALMDKGTCPYKTLALDSATTMAEACMHYVLKGDSKATDGQNPQIQHYGSQISLLKMVFDQFASWPCIKIVTAHIQRNTNSVTETIEMLPLVTGKLAGMIGIYFDDVWYTAVEKDKDTGKRKWVVVSESDKMIRQAKTRFSVPSGTELTWQAVEPYIKGLKSAYP